MCGTDQVYYTPVTQALQICSNEEFIKYFTEEMTEKADDKASDKKSANVSAEYKNFPLRDPGVNLR